MPRPAVGLIEEELTESVIAAFYATYNELGYGFVEHIYALALQRELVWRGHRVEREFPVMIMYRGRELARQRLDFVVDAKLVVEIKATRELHPSAARQLQSYLRASRFQVGLLLHFGPRAQFSRLVWTQRPGTGRKAGVSADLTDSADAADGVG